MSPPPTPAPPPRRRRSSSPSACSRPAPIWTERARRRRHGPGRRPARRAPHRADHRPAARPARSTTTVLVTPRPADEPRPPRPQPTPAVRPPAPRARRRRRPRRRRRRRSASASTSTCSSTPRTTSSARVDHEWCAVAGTQMVLAHARQGAADAGVPEGARVADRRVGEPARQPQRRLGAVGDGRGARGVRRRRATRSAPTRRAPTPCATRPGRSRRSTRPVMLLAWRGAHTWVMTGLPRRRRPARVRRREGQRAPTSSTRGTRASRRSGGRRTRRARTRTPPRCAATTCPGSGPRATTRTATGCSSRSCPTKRAATAERSGGGGSGARRRPRRAPHPAARGRPPGAPSATAQARPRTRAGSRRSRRGPRAPGSTTIVTANPASDASSGSSVLWVAYRPRASRWPRASNGTASANAASTVAVEPDVLGVERAAAEQHLDRERPDDDEPDRRERPTATPIVERAAAGPGAGTRRGRRPPRRRTASGRRRARSTTPISATGTLWKLRAKLTAETLPADERRRDAGEEQERQRLDRVADHLGHHQPQELAQGGHPQVEPEPDAHGRAAHADEPDAEVQERADDRADGGRHDPEPVVEQHGARRRCPTL